MLPNMSNSSLKLGNDQLGDSVQLGVETGRVVVLVDVPPLGLLDLVGDRNCKEGWLYFREML